MSAQAPPPDDAGSGVRNGEVTAAPRDGLRSPVLVLNRSYHPVRVTTARQAFLLLYLGRARAIDAQFEVWDFDAWCALAPGEDDDAIGTPRGPLRVPRIVLLWHYNSVPRTPLRLSRRNVFLRDGYMCQYCGGRPMVRDLNLDHVVPRSRGGLSSWENLVTSCRDCNVRKGRSTPDECGMPLRKVPARPNWSMAARLEAFPRRFVEWEPFLGSGAGRGPLPDDR